MKCVVTGCWAPIAAVVIGMSLGLPAGQAEVVGFDDLTLGPDGYWNGHQRWSLDHSAKDGLFVSGGLTFDNHYDEDWEVPFWHNWSYSDHCDTSQTGNGGLDGQYCAYAKPAGGADGTPNYGVACVNFWGSDLPTIYLPAGWAVRSLKVTNTVYARHVMLQGNPFAKRFGGASGDDPDWFLLTIIAKNGDQAVGSQDLYLADYRSPESSADYIVEDWTEVELSALSGYDRLEFTLASSDTDPIYGMNTPAYFALDSIDVVPEPSVVVLLLSAIAALVVAQRCRPRGISR